MNFKDAYRAANDEIHGDRSILAGITEEKPEKIIYFKPALGMVAVAAVCLVALLVYPYIGIHPSDKETPHQSNEDIFLASEQTEGLAVPGVETFGIARKAEPGAKESVPEYSVQYNLTADTSKKTVPEGNLKAVTADDYVSEVTESVVPEAAEVDSSVAETDSLVPEAVPPTGVIAEKSSAEEIFTDSTSESTELKASSGGGGGGSTTVSENSFITGVNGDSITVNHPNRGEITLKITENTEIVNTCGEALTAEALQEGVAVEITVAGETAVKIIIK